MNGTNDPTRRLSYRLLVILVTLAITGLSCRAQQRLFATPAPTLDPATVATVPAEEPGAARSAGETAEPAVVTATPAGTTAADIIATRLPSPEPRQSELEPFSCAAPNPAINGLLQETTPETWLDWIEKLSGEEPVEIGGEEVLIETRYSPAMFDGLPHARAFEYVQQTVLEWYPEEQVEAVSFTVRSREGESFTWQNLVLTLPGETSPEEVVILSAHLDSTSSNPMARAPGAEDNASGSAALLEAARLFRDLRFERTVQIVWFTGEEQGLLGSRAFVKALPDPDAVVGAVNLDMFGYDSNDDRCFELHVGTMSESKRVGECFVDGLEAYDLPLERYDYKTGSAMDASDHGSFWDGGIGAIEVFENMFDDDMPGGCRDGDMNPNYHSPNDQVEGINAESGILLVRASLATIAAIAGPLE